MKRIAVAVVIASSLTACATTPPPVGYVPAAPISGDRGADMVADLVLVRPLGLIGTVVGAAGFVIALPFTLTSGSVGESAQELVAEPFLYTFSRPLGDFGYYRPERERPGF